jgi:hypothetical protein
MASLKVQELHVPSGVASPVSAVELTVKVLLAAWAGAAAIVLAITIVARSSSPAISALVLVPHISTCLLVWVLIFPFSFLPPS